MKLQTLIPFSKESRNPISYDSELLLLGSCFTENMGRQLEYFRFRNLQNPFGILFHPIAIEKLLQHAINKRTYTESDFFLLNEAWHCFDVHSDLNNRNCEKAVADVNKAIDHTHHQLKSASHVVITLGTAWIYRLISTDTIVANCHKVPQKKFSKELLSIDDIVESLEAMIALVREVNPEVTFIFTISPVRHLKDGFTENQRSKSHLIAAVHEVLDKRRRVHYFPSYEIMMDELRDYRFYKKDMIHPNQIAIEYIWEKFVHFWFSDDAQSSMELVDKIQKNLKHKPFNPDSKSHQAFVKVLQTQIAELQKKHPFIKF